MNGAMTQQARDDAAPTLGVALPARAVGEDAARGAYWACQAAGWSLYWLSNVWSAATFGAVPWVRASTEQAVLVGIGLLLSHLMHASMRVLRWGELRGAARVVAVLVASAAFGLVAGSTNLWLGLAAWQTDSTALGEPELAPVTRFLVVWANWTILYAVWNAIHSAVLAARARRQAELREAELAAALQAAELRFLKSQLNPHFLFNALNAVRALIADEPARAQSAVTQLARMLRYALSSGQRDVVTLDQELEVVNDYLEIETLRLGDRLRVERRVAPDTRGVQVPVMLVQLLVENAIKHGIAELTEGGTLAIVTDRQGDDLVLEVVNPRPQPARPASGEGVGIANARARLQLLFGARATLTLDLSDAARAVARVRLPVRL